MKRTYLKRLAVATFAGFMTIGSMPLNVVSATPYENTENRETHDEVHPLLIEFFSNLDNSNLPMVTTTFYLGEGIYVEIVPHLARRAVRTIRSIMLMTQPVTGNWILPNIPAGTFLTISHSITAHQDGSMWHFVPSHTAWQGQNISGWVNALDVQ